MRQILLFSLLVASLMACDSPTPSATDTPASSSIDFDPQPYISRGQDITDSAFDVLRQHLMQGMQNGGPVAAVDVCNLKALPLLDSLSAAYGVRIARTSLQLRNPANAPDSLEREMLLLYAEKWPSGDKNPKVLRTTTGVRYFRPIGTLALCLSCHGEPEGALKERLTSLYPTDAATGYREGQFRGLWSLQFNP